MRLAVSGGHLIPADAAWRPWAVAASFALPVVAALVNLRYWGFRILLAGLCANALVMGTNQWRMPVISEELARVGVSQEAIARQAAANGDARHVLKARAEEPLWFLADAIVLPGPARRMISVGDILALLAVPVVVFELVVRTRHPERIRGGRLSEV